MLPTSTTFAFALKEIVFTPSPSSTIIAIIRTLDENNVVVVRCEMLLPFDYFQTMILAYITLG